MTLFHTLRKGEAANVKRLWTGIGVRCAVKPGAKAGFLVTTRCRQQTVAARLHKHWANLPPMGVIS